MRTRRGIAVIVLGIAACAPNVGDVVLGRVLAPVALDLDEGMRLTAAAIDNIAEQLICFGIRDVSGRAESPSGPLLDLIRSKSVISRDDCPPNYASAMVSADSMVKGVAPETPAAYSIPVHLTLLRVREESSRHVLVLMYGQGPSGWFYHCPIPELIEASQDIACEKRGRWIA